MVVVDRVIVFGFLTQDSLNSGLGRALRFSSVAELLRLKPSLEVFFSLPWCGEECSGVVRLLRLGSQCVLRLVQVAGLEVAARCPDSPEVVCSRKDTDLQRDKF